MQRQDYIEKIATFIADGWYATDEGNQAACKAAIQPVTGSPSPNSARQTCTSSQSRVQWTMQTRPWDVYHAKERWF